MRQTLLLLATCLAMAGCNAAPPKDAPKDAHKETPMDATITLLPEASASVAPSSSLRFDRVEDSRCPPDVRCITAGKLLYHFTLSAPSGQESFALEKEAPSFASAKVPGVRIALAPGEPPVLRPSTAAEPLPVFPVTVSITRRQP